MLSPFILVIIVARTALGLGFEKDNMKHVVIARLDIFLRSFSEGGRKLGFILLLILTKP